MATIGSFAFSYCKVFTGSFILPNSVTTIKGHAFDGCNINAFEILQNNQNYSVIEGVLFNKNSTLLITYPPAKFGAYTFPNSVTSIGDYAFVGCTYITSITIPNSVTSIGNYAFQSCSGITSINLPNSLTSIGNYAFAWCTGITSLNFPNSIKTIGNFAFYNCSGITTVNLPASLTTISISSFEHCNGIKTLTLPTSLTSIGEAAFRDCIGITGIITFPTTLTSIGNYAFYNCSGITSITLPASLTSIGNYAFYFCTGIAGSLILPTGITSIGFFAFNYCTGIKTLTLPNSLISMGEAAFSGCTGITSLALPNSLTSIGGSAFSGCTGITTLTLPTTLISIGGSAFGYCSGIKTLTLPTSLTTIETGAFSNCTSITGSLTLPIALTSIGDYAFSSCTSINFITSLNPTPPTLSNFAFTNFPISIVYVPSTAGAAYKVASGWSAFNIAAENRVTFNNPTPGSLGSALITAGYSPLSSITHLTVTGNLNSVDITQIKTNTTSLTFIDMSGSTVVGNSIPANAFQSKILLTSIIIPTTITSIGDYAFDGCTNLSSAIPLPAAVTSIGNYAYRNCKFLSGSLTIPAGVTTIGTSVFSGCSGLTGILTIPLLVTSIADGAFYGCSKFNELNFSKNTSTTIADNAFYGCVGLTKIFIPRFTPPTIYTNTFGGVNKQSCNLEVPTSTSHSYQTATYWSQFTILSESNKADIYGITIQLSSNGVVLENNISLVNGFILTVDKATTKTLTFTPNAGYEVATLTYGGVDVKSQLVNNQYTTPSVNANATLSATFQKIQYRISQKSAESGTMNLLCEYGATPSFDFTPSTGWKVSTVFYNNVDVTSSLVNGVFTVSAITNNSLLNVAFVSTATGAPELINSRLKVYTTKSEIIIEGTSVGEPITLYSLNGKQLQTIKSQGEKIAIPTPTNAVYLVKTSGKTFKVRL